MHAQTATVTTPPSAQHCSYRECFGRHIAEARSISAREVVVFRGDAPLALANVRIALDNLAPHLSEVPLHLPLVRFEDVTSAADVARAVLYAGLSIVKRPQTNAEIRTRTKRLLPMRASVLGLVRTLVDREAMPASALRGVGRKRGPRAIAAEAVLLAHALTANADAIRGMHPFSAAEIEQLRADGEWLLEVLHPTGARRRKAQREDTPSGDRDRLWTLLIRRHATLRKVGHYFHGDAYDDVVPPLLSRVKVQLAEEQIDAPTPAPAPQPVG